MVVIRGINEIIANYNLDSPGWRWYNLGVFCPDDALATLK